MVLFRYILINLFRHFYFLLLLFFFNDLFAGKVKGIIYDHLGKSLPYSTVSVQSRAINVISNENGLFSFDIQPGKYLVTIMHVGYKTKEITITVADKELDLRIIMEPNTLMLDEVIIRPNGEDPAYEIIRKTIRKRKENASAISSFSCESYLKGVVRTNAYPETFMGRKIDFEDGDTSKQKIIFLSETISDIHFRQPDETRVIVNSTKVSGQSNGFGLANPILLSFYENTISLPKIFNPRGFISPIADMALSFYRYKYLGAFTENGYLINRIQVIPKRKWEPLFSGYIQIIEDNWKIHSLDLFLDKESQLELAAKLRISQQYEKAGYNSWIQKSQHIELLADLFGFSAIGNFTTLYSKYNINEESKKSIFGSSLIKFDSLSNKRNEQFWNDNRPIPLLDEEIKDYRKKDSLEQKRSDPLYLDSLDKIQNKVTFTRLLLNGQSYIHRSKSYNFELDPLLKNITYNTVEGWSLQFAGSYQKQMKGRNSLSITPVIRYGTANAHLNAFVNSRYQFGNKLLNSIGVGMGKRIFQFNNRNPIPQIVNTYTTLLNGNNFMKIYEAKFVQFDFFKGLGKGFDLDINFMYQDRKSLQNLDDINLWTGKASLINITPNYPVEISSTPMLANRSAVLGLRLRYRPGEKYIEYPDRIVRAFTKAPQFALQLDQGIPSLFSSQSDFSKWRISVSQDLDFKIAGELKYMVQTGGFLYNNFTAVPDYNHLPGNLTRRAAAYVRNFQVAPFYALSNTDRFYTTIFLEQRFNGMLTNKIPLVKRLNLRLTAGGNLFFTGDRSYAEFFIGLDNILKVFRFDYVWGMGKDFYPQNGIKIGIRGFSNLFNEY